MHATDGNWPFHFSYDEMAVYRPLILITLTEIIRDDLQTIDHDLPTNLLVIIVPQINTSSYDYSYFTVGQYTITII